MSTLYDELMELAIMDESTEEYKERRSLQESNKVRFNFLAYLFAKDKKKYLIDKARKIMINEYKKINDIDELEKSYKEFKYWRSNIINEYGKDFYNEIKKYIEDRLKELKSNKK